MSFANGRILLPLCVMQGTVILVAAFCKRDSKESRNAFAEHEGARVFP